MLRIISYGGGWQSNAMLVLAAEGQIDYQTFVFCNVGEDSENPETLVYIKDYARPYAEKHGIKFIELQKIRRDGSQDTIYSHLMRPNSHSIEIPVRMANGAPGRRSCTYDFKIAVVDKWLRAHTSQAARQELTREMVLFAENPEHAKRILEWNRVTEPLAQVGLGISLDEIERMKPNLDKETMAWKENTFPLLTEVARPLTRIDCGNIITRAGLPLPPKSACIFCPFTTLARWQDMRRNQPGQFWRVVSLQNYINEKRARLGLDAVWFVRQCKPLEEVTTELYQESLFEIDEQPCESGYCFV